MEAYFIYLIKSSGVLILFWATYQLLLKRDTFFTANRWFLNFGIIASIVLPFIYFKTFKVVEIPLSTTATTSPSTLNNTIENVSITATILSYAFYGYLLGVLFFSTKLLIQLASLYRFIRKGTLQKGDFNHVLTEENMSPFSFFNYIVYNPTLYNDNELQTILTHEEIHVRQYHSIDVILLHLYTIIFWVNPFAWLYKKVHTQNLEYITDLQTSIQLNTQKEYQYLLLKQLNGMQYSVINPFYNSLIKKRIVMLQKQKSSKINLVKYTLILPLLAGFMLLFSFKTETKFNHLNEKETNTKQNINKQPDNPIYVIDGKIMPKDFDINSIDPTTISHINVLKNENAVKKYGKKGKNGVIEIILKTNTSEAEDKNAPVQIEKINPNQLIILDEKEISREELSKIDSEKIKLITVFKNEVAVEKYGEKGKNGVIIIQTKEGSKE